ncbi:hypothetical protein LZ480_06210 [Solibacillus sp. MA9]|uniref:Uncharacterized protein n=1 Tax=Solibacillus palustris TaxID=2908203 RepID=A0ABS9UAY3_9BACL|nr:hypothetical protein [Solibacillus sp. MA9]MCH7321484.1 hypothetical protein [Solibacillus sp. MA9]
MFDPTFQMDANNNAFDHTQQQFEAEYGSGLVDNTFQLSPGVAGYNELYFGNDPLSKAHQYQCPQFTKVTWIDPYIKSDGTLVDGHFRSMPDDTTLNNLNRF